MGEFAKIVVVPLVTTLISEGAKIMESKEKRKAEREKDFMLLAAGTMVASAVLNYMEDKVITYKNNQQEICISKK